MDHPACDPRLYIRPARDTDAWDLIGLIAACWAEYPGLVLDVHGEAPWLLAPASAYADRGGRLWVVEARGRAVASAGFVPSPWRGGIELRTLYVARPYRERRLGGELLALVEEEARRRGLTFVDLWTDARFLDAQRFYERRGYRRGPTRVVPDLSRSVEFYYRKDLPAQCLVPPAPVPGSAALRLRLVTTQRAEVVPLHPVRRDGRQPEALAQQRRQRALPPARGPIGTISGRSPLILPSRPRPE
jgi:GNAT superfamily N-acetyltransferase